MSRAQKQELADSLTMATPPQIPSPNPALAESTYTYSSVVQKIFKLFLAVGSVVVLIFAFRDRRNYKKSKLFVLVLSSIALLLLIVVAPNISNDYNFERLYQQVLPIAGIAVFIGFMAFWKKLKVRRIGLVVTAILLMSYMYAYSGLFAQIVGGSPTMQLANSGYAYSQFYKHKGEVAAAQWLTQRRADDENIATDTYGRVKLSAYVSKKVHLSERIYESAVRSKSYMYKTYPNKNDGIALFSQNGQPLSVLYPDDFVKLHQSQIYTTGGSAVLY